MKSFGSPKMWLEPQLSMVISMLLSLLKDISWVVASMVNCSKYHPYCCVDSLVVVMSLIMKLMNSLACLLSPCSGSGGSHFISRKMTYATLIRVSIYQSKYLRIQVSYLKWIQVKWYCICPDSHYCIISLTTLPNIWLLPFCQHKQNSIWVLVMFDFASSKANGLGCPTWLQSRAGVF